MHTHQNVTLGYMFTKASVLLQRLQSLTPSLLCCHMKTTNKSAKFKPVSLCVFFFALACERIFIKTHSIESVKGPENILFVGSSLHLSARKLYRLEQ